MTMKPNTELNTMMFFDDALEGERTQLLTELADAVSETRTAADQAAELNEDRRGGPAAPDGNLVRHERRPGHRHLRGRAVRAAGQCGGADLRPSASAPLP